jgi:hypothetical protein
MKWPLPFPIPLQLNRSCFAANVNWALPSCFVNPLYECVSRSFRTQSITKYALTTINTRWEATQSVMAAKLTRLTHTIAIQLHIVAESCTICSYCSRRPVRKLLDTPSYVRCYVMKPFVIMYIFEKLQILEFNFPEIAGDISLIDFLKH